MPKIKYQSVRFSEASLLIIAKANEIIADYTAQGLDLTLRQLYYQFVARDLIANKDTEYKRLGSIINDARMAGLIDWYAIEDRTRHLRGLSHWDDPAEIISATARGFTLDRWEGQKFRPEVWIEKDALVGVIQGVCNQWDVPFFSCRGYTSQSEMWRAGQRLDSYVQRGQTPVIFHFGDHDPSGIDMSRDIADRLTIFMGGLNVERLALNMPQIEEYQPPPNPAKVTDSRARAYIRTYGDESWELDALEPKVLGGLIEAEVTKLIDHKKWRKIEQEEKEGRRILKLVADRFDEVQQWVTE